MDTTTNLSQYYLKVQALTPQSGAPLISSTSNNSLMQDWFSLSLAQILIFSGILLLALIAIFTLRLNKIKNIGSFLFLLFMASTIPIGVLLTRQSTQIESSASPTYIPKNVIITNVTATSFTLLWETDKSGYGVIRLRSQPEQSPLAKIYQETETEDTYQHSLTISDLVPQTTYYFEILSGDTWFDNAGQPLKVSTPSI